MHPQIQKQSSRVHTIYAQQLDAWVSALQRRDLVSTTDPLSQQYYSEVFLAGVCRQLGVRVCMDNTAADVLYERIKQPEYLRFCLGEPTTQTRCEEKWLGLLDIARVLYEAGFIVKRRYRKIVYKADADMSIEGRLIRLNAAIQEEGNCENQEGQLKKLQLWKQIIKIEFSSFWLHHVLNKPVSVRNSKDLQRCYRLYRAILRHRLKQQIYKKICQLFAFIDVIEQQWRNQSLLELGQSVSLFADSEIIKRVQKQCLVFENFLKIQLQKQLGITNGIKIQPYGSYRCKLSSQNSDIDLTIFIPDQQGAYCTDRDFITRRLWKVYNVMNRLYKLGHPDIKVQSCHPIINDRIRVPFLCVKFDNTAAVVPSMDLVVNNTHGVDNSVMIEAYAEDRIFRVLAILIKKWAKKRDLISRQDMSSYGITLMFLHYLMQKGLLGFITREQMAKRAYSTTIKWEAGALAVLTGFFEYYHSWALKNPQKNVVCLLQGCKDHAQIVNDIDLLIHIHDPFNNTDTGRIKYSKYGKFLHEFQSTEEALKSAAKYSTKQFRAAVRQIFAIS